MANVADAEEIKVFHCCRPQFLAGQNAYRAIERVVATTDYAAGQHAERQWSLGDAIAKGVLTQNNVFGQSII
ncbi:hypothetical protein ASC85_07915 [Pseudomonas sp. Root401]|nr:hypothetical protein ASC85_07915 [Pseudomonas sp. Root401]